MAVTTTDRKLFLGARLKRLRRDLGLTQTRMAEDLGVSPSYLNLLERNQRPVTAQVLLRLAEAYDLDLKSLATDPEDGGATGLSEVFSDQMFRDLGVARHEIAEVAESAPGVSEAIVRLYRAYLDQRRLTDLGAIGRPEEGAGTGPSVLPSDWVRDFFQAQKNYFAELEEAADALTADLTCEPLDFALAARERLSGRHGISVRVVPVEVLPESVRRYDHHRKRLFLSEALTAEGRAFAQAYQLALLEYGPLLDALVDRSGPPDRSTRGLLKVSLTNYLAAAVMMPYAAFHEAAERSAYDIELVRARFGVSFEQACHRLTTLARPGARGVPFFMLRVDSAGNISKRFAGATFPFSRFGGTCPRWNIHTSFRTPGRIATQIVETPDGQRYFTLSRTVSRFATPYSEGDTELAIGMGCELKFAERLVYSRGIDLRDPVATAIGPACRICERAACPQRAAEPINRTLMVDDFTKSISPYPFASG
ncbi:short-chain fatty acyl-CoA regulator family protein [Phenylobacterium sp. NIBR 498073]|uniref:helix-turn-helix domain-containing protein n=1 Tax=Phenylobacterium sp. NIBR 498073 TaxID=3015177 RepID=UPI0022B2ED1D|nr:short-chain fatty acyl-CoA regulator family protein [Phenylobacterium sp. NIBR 498073]WGU39969.1 short-chain fatty acyl-CoA regulator family protein [Phenylobacterium sp. NIBR 498073]